MPDNQFIPPGVGNTMPLAISTSYESNTLVFDYFDTIPQSANIGLGITRSDFPGSGFFIDDAGWIYMVSGQSGSAINLISSGVVSVHAGNGGTAQDILLYGSDVKLNGVSIVASGAAPYPDITDVSGKVGINQTNPAYRLDVAGDINFTGTLYQNGTAYGGGGGGFTPSGSSSQFIKGDGSYDSNNYLAVNPAYVSIVSDFLTLTAPSGGSVITFDAASGYSRIASDNAGVLWFDPVAGGLSIQSADGSSEINSNTSKAQLRRNGYGEVTIGAGTIAIYGMSGTGIDIDTSGNVSINNGFTGTGTYTNFTIVGGVITAAS